MFLLVPDYPGGPGQEAVKRSCVCLRVLVTLDRRVLSKRRYVSLQTKRLYTASHQATLSVRLPVMVRCRQSR